MASYKVYYEILNPNIKLYEEHHMYVGAHSHSEAETMAKGLVKSIYHCEPRITTIRTPEEEKKAKLLADMMLRHLSPL